MNKIFVTDGRSLAALAIARSLGRKGIEVHCGEEFRHNITFFSRYIKRRIVYPSPKKAPDEFMKAIFDLIKAENYDMLLPVRDDTSLLFSEHKEELSKYTSLFLADHRVMETFEDKGKTVKAALEQNIPCPKTYFPEDSDLETIKDTASYPLLIRPRISSGSRGIGFVNCREDFDAVYRQIKRGYGEPIVQEQVAKKGYCTACILLDGSSEEIASFTYERVKEYPLSGGPTVIGISCINERVKSYALRLLQGLKWMGVAEVEFIIDPQGVPRLLEVNPRFWMPLHLAIHSGVDFPWLLYRQAMGEKVEPVTTYRVGIKYRWVLPSEILWLMKTPHKLRGIKEFINFWDGETCYGELSFNDPLPAAGVLLQSLNYIASPEKRALIFNRGWATKR